MKKITKAQFNAFRAIPRWANWQLQLALAEAKNQRDRDAAWAMWRCDLDDLENEVACAHLVPHIEAKIRSYFGLASM